MIENIILFILFLSILIFVHELGHFLFAKLLKVEVEEFGIGFPPKIFAKKINNTVYSFNLIIFGGFVKLRGETDPHDPLGFLSQPPYKKILITLGGVIANLIFAYLLISFDYLIGLPEYSDKFENVVILQVFNGSPAEKAGLRPGDKILYFKDSQGSLINIENPQKIRDILRNYLGQEIFIEIERENQKRELKLIPEIKDNQGPLGLAFSSVVLVKSPFPVNFLSGLKKTFALTKNLLVAFKDFFQRLFKELKVAKDVVGPLGIFDAYKQMKELGINYLLYFSALISLNLMLINILPFPALDGGRFLIYFGELIARKKIPYQIESIVNIFGILILLTLMILITIKDLYFKFKIK